MKLNELFNSKSKIERDQWAGPRGFETNAVINDADYFFVAIALGGEKETYWSVSFGIRDLEGSLFGSTDAGVPLQVLSFVKKSFEDFVKEKQPEKIVFTGENGRGPVYKRMLEKFNTGYDVKTEAIHKGTKFTLTKKHPSKS